MALADDASVQYLGELKTEIADTEAKLAAQEGEYGKEKAIVDEIMALRAKRAAAGSAAAPAASGLAGAAGVSEAATPPAAEDDPAALSGKLKELEAINPEQRMIYAHVEIGRASCRERV